MRKRLIAEAVVLLGLLAPPGAAHSVTWYVDSSVASSGDGSSWATAFKQIQEGIDASSDGDTVIVAQGTYVENIHFHGKNITLRSTDPLDPAIVAATVIDGHQSGSVVTFEGTETDACTLSGFTVRNGLAESGGGILGGRWDRQNLARIENNTVEFNRAGAGGGLYLCSGTVRGNIIQNNSATYGGGLSGCDGVIEGNFISANSAFAAQPEPYGEGGGLASCEGEIRHNTITNNFAGAGGGGLSRCSGVIEDNLISGNRAYEGGGLSYCDALILRNRIFRNEAYYGGGLSHCDLVTGSSLICGNRAVLGGGLYGENRVHNTVISANIAHEGGGAWGDDNSGYNCILWGNVATEGPQLAGYFKPRFRYSCIEGWSEGGEGNISLEPMFADPDGPDDDPDTYEDNDYRLLPDSPCIDAGYNGPYYLPRFDLDGNLRVAFGGKSLTVDMGAYEYSSKPFAVTEVAVISDTALSLTWNSQPNDTYVLWVCTDPVFQTWARGATVPSDGATTTFTVVNIAPFPSYQLFRIEMTSP